MNYLFETEHFLLRNRIPANLCIPESFPEKQTIRFPLREDFANQGNIPYALTIEFRATGAPAGNAMIKTLGSGEAEVLCCFCREVRKKDFKTEIIDALSAILSFSASVLPCKPDRPLPELGPAAATS